eukprot:2770522-Rhodomonas_salina.1
MELSVKERLLFENITYNAHIRRVGEDSMEEVLKLYGLPQEVAMIVASENWEVNVLDVFLMGRMEVQAGAFARFIDENVKRRDSVRSILGKTQRGGYFQWLLGFVNKWQLQLSAVVQDAENNVHELNNAVPGGLHMIEEEIMIGENTYGFPTLPTFISTAERLLAEQLDAAMQKGADQAAAIHDGGLAEQWVAAIF